MWKDLVFPLDVRHPVQQLVEFFGREGRTESRDSSGDLTTCGGDCFFLSSVIHLALI
jgi:hypothetical protein